MGETEKRTSSAHSQRVGAILCLDWFKVALLCHPSICEMIVLFQTSRLPDFNVKRAFDQNSFLSSSIGPRVKLASLHVPDSATYLFLKHCHFRLNQAQGKSRFYSCFLIRVSYFLLVF
jgi:hypothetical protein